MCMDRLSVDVCLPEELLEAILGFVDRETLCTARLVSKTFCAAASAHICSLRLYSASQAVYRHRFPRLEHVTLLAISQGAFSQVDPCLRDLVTDLTILGCQAPAREILSQAALMPKLQKLGLLCDLEGNAALLGRCTNLESVVLPTAECTPAVLTILAAITSLTSLHFCSIYLEYDTEVDPWAQPSGISWFEHATALRNLQALNIATPSEALPLIGNLTGLTRLAWSCCDPLRSAYSIAPLTRLTRLRSLELKGEDAMSEGNAGVACSLGSGAMARLTLHASEGCGRFLTRQTALTCLSLRGQVCNSRHIGALRLERLQSLTLHGFACEDAGGVAALHRASSLTSLCILISRGNGGIQLPALRLSQAPASLTQLRSLNVMSEGGVPIAEPDAKLLDYAAAMRPLTRLTCLDICRGRLDNGDLRALLVLTGLRVLALVSDCLTDDVVPELSVLTNLRLLSMKWGGVTSLAPVTKAVNPVRHAMGWPPLDATPE